TARGLSGDFFSSLRVFSSLQPPPPTRPPPAPSRRVGQLHSSPADLVAAACAVAPELLLLWRTLVSPAPELDWWVREEQLVDRPLKFFLPTIPKQIDSEGFGQQLSEFQFWRSG